MCITDVQQSPPGAPLWLRGNRGVGHLRSLMSGLAVVHKKARGPQKTLGPRRPHPTLLHPLQSTPALPSDSRRLPAACFSSSSQQGCICLGKNQSSENVRLMFSFLLVKRSEQLRPHWVLGAPVRARRKNS